MAAFSQNYQFYRRHLFRLVQMYKNRQDVRIFLELLLSLFAISAFGIFAIRPTIVTIASLTTEIKTKEETILFMDRKIQAITDAQQAYEQEKSNIELLDTAVPSDPQVQSFIKQIELVAIRHNLTVELMSAKSVGLKGKFPKNSIVQPSNPLSEETQLKQLPSNADSVSISVNVSGNFADLSAFLKDIERMRRPVLIDSVSMDSTVTSQSEKIVLGIVGRVVYANE